VDAVIEVSLTSNAAAYPGVLCAHGSVVVCGMTGAEATLPALWMMQNAIALKFLMIYGIPAADREAGLAEVKLFCTLATTPDHCTATALSQAAARTTWWKKGISSATWSC